MATSAKTGKRKPATSSYSVRRLAPRRATTTPSRRSAPSDSQNLVRRVQTILPGAKRRAESNPAKVISAALERATGGATRAPLTNGTLGILAGGIGAVAVAKRRHNHDPNELPGTSSTQTTNASAESTRQRLEIIADPSATTGGDHGDSQGPDSATAA
jgi:hypothetical protein